MSFFPKGGYLAAGYPCRVAFKALADDGLSIGITGAILDSKGMPVDSLRTLHAGMGCVCFTPQPGEYHYTECAIPSGATKRFELPSSENTACVLNVTQTNDNITVGVRSEQPWPEELALAILCRGQLYSCKAWNSAQQVLTFERTAFPGGVLQVLLLDKDGHALSERLLFNRGDESAPTSVSCADIPEQRRKLLLDVRVSNSNGTPAAGNFAISVADSNAVPAPASASIYAALLLSSELRENIETSDWYFDVRIQQPEQGSTRGCLRKGGDAMMCPQRCAAKPQNYIIRSKWDRKSREQSKRADFGIAASGWITTRCR